MSELGFLAFGFDEEVDPVEAVQKTAASIENITRELDERGITAFALQADSAPEVEQRLLMREVNAAIDEIVERYLPEDDDAKKRVVSNIFRQFEASRKLAAEVGSYDHWDDTLLCPGFSPNAHRGGHIAGAHGMSGMRLSRNPDAKCDMHGATGISVRDPNPEVAKMARAISDHISATGGFSSRVMGERPEYGSREERGQHHAELLQQHEEAVRMAREGGIQEALPGFESRVKEGAEAPGRQWAQNYPGRYYQIGQEGLNFNPIRPDISPYGWVGPDAAGMETIYCGKCGRRHEEEGCGGQDTWTRENMRPGLAPAKASIHEAATGTGLLDPEVKLTPESRSGIKAGTHCKFCAEPLDRPEVPDPNQPIEPEGAHRSCLDSRIYGGTWCSGCDQPIASDDADAVQLKRTRMHQPCAKEFLDTYGKDEYMQRYIQGDSDEQLEEFRRQRAEEYKKKKEEEAAAAAAALRESVDAPPPSNGRGSSN